MKNGSASHAWLDHLLPSLISHVVLKSLTTADSMLSLNYRALASYISDNNYEGFRSFLDTQSACVDDKDENGWTALMLSASKGKLRFVKDLILHGADVNAEDLDNWSSLLSAAKEGHVAICAELLDHGAQIDHKDMGGWTALLWACYKGQTDTARLLMERKAEVNMQGQFHMTPLAWAAGRGHLDIVKDLLYHGARVNCTDKHGTTPLIWACRKGYLEIVDVFLKAGAVVDVTGMYSWTPLLVAVKGNFVDIVQRLLEKRPNVNACDKDGYSSLTIACKNGYTDVAVALLNAGAYVNTQDRFGDTNLIHSAKAGHKFIVEALVKKYADIDMQGKDRKSALYWAVEKNHAHVVKCLLTAEPNLEIATKDGDTALLKGVRNRNVEIVQMLLDKKAKVHAMDKVGDTALHISMRARSKNIVELLLRNPKNSQLLYRPNRAGETPYNIDASYQKTIMGQIFGARRLNANEDNESLLGYDLYSSALADILSEPLLSMPITLGLYAKWGSGKSFLLTKLKEEMKGFARQWVSPTFQWTTLLLVLVLHGCALLALALACVSHSWIVGVAVVAASLVTTYTFLYTVWWGSHRYSWSWAHSISLSLAKRLQSFELIVKVTFCTPPGPKWGDGLQVYPVKFFFTEQTKVSRTGDGEETVVQILGSLLEAIEADYGIFPTRLYRAFRPRPVKSTASWRWRRFCCLPYFAVFLSCVDSIFAMLVLLVLFLAGDIHADEFLSIKAILIALAILLGLVFVANMYTWSRLVKCLWLSPRRRLQNGLLRAHAVKGEGYLQALKKEVALLVDMVKCLDAFTRQQTRLVVVVDGLDSCEQDKVLYVLDAVRVLFAEANTPFIVLLTVDPHVITKAVQLNIHEMLSDTNIGAHEYLRNLVHLPFFLQNAGLRKVRAAQQAALAGRASRPTNTTALSNAVRDWLESDEMPHVSPRRMSIESTAQAPKKISRASRPQGAGLLAPGLGIGNNLPGSKLRHAESLESCLGLATGQRVAAAHDLTKVLLSDDYFSDVNPRSMRRLLNVIYVTGRLLKAFQIEFNWYHLATWINITEQWPYRTSWIILYYETFEDRVEDTMTLKSIYDKVRPQIPSKESEVLLEMDKDDKKIDVFLSMHKNNLLVLHLKMFLPFTINLDPYLRKVIKEEKQVTIELEPSNKKPNRNKPNVPGNGEWETNVTVPPWTVTLPTPEPTYTKDGRLQSTNPMMSWLPQMNFPTPYLGYPGMAEYFGHRTMPSALSRTVLPHLSKLPDTALSTLTTEEVCDMLKKLDGLKACAIEKYQKAFQENNITGRVLSFCNLDELKQLIGMNFGDWELFKMTVTVLREKEMSGNMQRTVSQSQSQMEEKSTMQTLDTDYDQGKMSRSSSMRSTMGQDENDLNYNSGLKLPKRSTLVEKQVTLEEQMIYGALQTLNEEAMEDVLDEKIDEDVQMPERGPLSSYAGSVCTVAESSEMDVLYLQTSVVPELGPALGYAGTDDSISSVAGSLASLAERGSNTPARQRHVTEVIWPENLASAVRSRLGSLSSLAHADSIKSIIDYGRLTRQNSQKSVSGSNSQLHRRGSQRSVSESASKSSVAQTTSPAPPTSSKGSETAGVAYSTRKNDCNSPRRPSSLVLDNSQFDWSTSQSKAGATPASPSAMSSPYVDAKNDSRFSSVSLRTPPQTRHRRAAVSTKPAIPNPAAIPSANGTTNTKGNTPTPTGVFMFSPMVKDIMVTSSSKSSSSSTAATPTATSTTTAAIVPTSSKIAIASPPKEEDPASEDEDDETSALLALPSPVQSTAMNKSLSASSTSSSDDENHDETVYSTVRDFHQLSGKRVEKREGGENILSDLALSILHRTQNALSVVAEKANEMKTPEEWQSATDSASNAFVIAIEDPAEGEEVKLSSSPSIETPV